MGNAVGYFKRNAIAFLALFVALGGSSYAAIRLPARSVGERELKTGAVSPRVLGAKAEDRLQGEQGPRGFAGPQGPQGLTGPSGTVGSAKVREATVNSDGLGDVYCLDGEIATGGGYHSSSVAPTMSSAIVEGRAPLDQMYRTLGWRVVDASPGAVVTVVCARP